MSNLRSKLIRLAYQNPALRAEILPLLDSSKTAAPKADAKKIADKAYKEHLNSVAGKKDWDKGRKLYDEDTFEGVDFIRNKVQDLIEGYDNLDEKTQNAISDVLYDTIDGGLS